jgi:hypothetical protein
VDVTFEEAIAQQPQWVNWWLNWMLVGAFILPIVLLFWRSSRMAGAAAVVASVLSALSINWMYGQLGYVKLLGLPHVILWTPLAVYLVTQLRRPDMAKWPRMIMGLVLATILISLAFDYTDVARYLLGERNPTAMPPEA